MKTAAITASILAACVFAVPASAHHHKPPPGYCQTGNAIGVCPGYCQTAGGVPQPCPDTSSEPAAVQADGNGLWCSDQLQLRSDGTTGNALQEPLAALPLAGVSGRFAWFRVGVGLTCDAGGAPTGRTVDQTGVVSGNAGQNVYQEVR